ncbi:MAG: homocysteine S-methyltransferase [Anaerolineales bacterium]
MNPIASLLQKQPLIVLDGALATELERRGADLNDPLWSAKVLLETPDLIRQVHLDYFRAGADVAITASYQASVEGFMRRGLGREQALDLMRLSVKLAQEARELFWRENTDPARAYPLVAGSVGPYGAYLADGSEYRGDYGLSEEELIDFHRPRMAALVEAGADLLACETIPCLSEARALARLLKEFPSASAWVSFSARDSAHTCHGEPVAECAAFLDGIPQVAAVGINCSAPQHIPGLIRAMAGGTRKPIVVYPNSGEVYDPATNTWHGETFCDAYGHQSREWYAAGARLIGGCCRTTPEHIRAIVSELRHV